MSEVFLWWSCGASFGCFWLEEFVLSFQWLRHHPGLFGPPPRLSLPLSSSFAWLLLVSWWRLLLSLRQYWALYLSRHRRRPMR